MPESPAKVVPDVLQMRANLNQVSRALDLKVHENNLLNDTLARMLKAAADLAKACMPLEAPEITKDLNSQNPELLIKHLERITQAMNSQQKDNMFEDQISRVNGHTNGKA